MSIHFYPADHRGHTQIDRLDSYHSFSFWEWYDPAQMWFGALRVLNDDTIQWGSGFPPHPHRDMEIMSIPLTGGLMHQDSMWHRTTITPDMIQVMSAGTGLAHAEYNAYQDQETSFLQIRIQPRSRGVSPRHDEKLIELTDNQLSLLVHPDASTSPSGGLSIHQDARIYRGKRNKSDTVTYTLQDPAHGVYVFVIAWSVSMDGMTAGPRDAMTIQDQDTIVLDIQAGADVLLMEVPMK